MRKAIGVVALALLLLAVPAAGHYVGLIYYPPALGDGGEGYVAGTDGVLYGLDRDGSPEWTYDVGREISTPAATAGDLVVAGTTDGRLFAVRAADGSQAWATHARLDGNGTRVGGLAVADGRLYATTRTAVVGLAAGNGSARWHVAADGRIFVPPAAGSDGAYVAVERPTNASLVALSPSGEVRWRREYDAGPGPPAVGPDGTVYVEVGGDLLALAPDGERLWRVAVGDGVARPAVGESLVVVGTFDGRIVAVRDDSVAWTVETGGVAAPTVGPDGETVYAVTPRSVVAARDGDLLWRRQVGATVTLPPAVGDRVHVGTQLNRSYALTRAGGVAWIDRYATRLGYVPEVAHDVEPPPFLANATGTPTRVVYPNGSAVAVDAGPPADGPFQGSGVGLLAGAAVVALLALAAARYRG